MTNTNRAKLAMKAINVATDWDGDEMPIEIETYAGDLIANLKHLCGQKGIDFDDVLRRGENHYQAEYKGDDITEPGDQDEAGRTLSDAHGNPFPAAMLYYQPFDPSGEPVDKSGKAWPTNAVWRSKATCTALFPANDIETYSGTMIDKPLFVDDEAAHDFICYVEAQSPGKTDWGRVANLEGTKAEATKLGRSYKRRRGYATRIVKSDGTVVKVL